MLPMFKKVLYATDLSPAAGHAFGFALSTAEKFGAQLTVLHVLPELPQEYGLLSGFDIVPDIDKDTWDRFKKNSIENAYKHLETQMAEACAAFGMKPLPKERLIIRNGKAAEVIVSEGRHADLVVMGTQGHGRIGGLVMGSVAQHVLSKSVTPVMVVRLEG